MKFLRKINSPSLRLMNYRSSLSDDPVAELRRWHERAYQELIVPGERRLSYLGLDLIVPPGVFPPTPMSDLLGHAVLEEVDAKDRVLDMGTGCAAVLRHLRRPGPHPGAGRWRRTARPWS